LKSSAGIEILTAIRHAPGKEIRIALHRPSRA
jgi:hypothetical protein